jgi:hypothetical protein
MVSFEGTRQGNAYHGSGYAFSKNCGALRFDMTGTAVNESSITFTGLQPQLYPNCEKGALLRVEWTFERIDGEARK